MRISDWSSDVCSSDLRPQVKIDEFAGLSQLGIGAILRRVARLRHRKQHQVGNLEHRNFLGPSTRFAKNDSLIVIFAERRSEEHTSELQSLMRISYAVFCLKKKNDKKQQNYIQLTSV